MHRRGKLPPHISRSLPGVREWGVDRRKVPEGQRDQFPYLLGDCEDIDEMKTKYEIVPGLAR